MVGGIRHRGARVRALVRYQRTTTLGSCSTGIHGTSGRLAKWGCTPILVLGCDRSLCRGYLLHLSVRIDMHLILRRDMLPICLLGHPWGCWDVRLGLNISLGRASTEEMGRRGLEIL